MVSSQVCDPSTSVAGRGCTRWLCSRDIPDSEHRMWDVGRRLRGRWGLSSGAWVSVTQRGGHPPGGTERVYARGNLDGPSAGLAAQNCEPRAVWGGDGQGPEVRVHGRALSGWRAA